MYSSDSFILTTTLIYNVQVAMSIRTTLSSNSYHSKYVRFINPQTHKQKRRAQQAEQTHNLLVSILVFVCESYIFYVYFLCFVYMLCQRESKSSASYVLLSMNMMRGLQALSLSRERFHDISRLEIMSMFRF